MTMIRALWASCVTVLLIGAHAGSVKVTAVATTATAMPTFPGILFGSFSFPTIGPDGSVTFAGFSPNNEGSGLFTIQPSSGAVQAIATTNTRAIGASSPFTGFRAGSGGEDYGFFVGGVGSSNEAALYSSQNKAVTCVANSTTPLPAPWARSRFTELDNPHFDGEACAWMGTTDGAGNAPTKGIYVLSGGQLHLAASTHTKLPDDKDNFGCLEDPQLVKPQDGFSSAVAFFGSNCGSPGLTRGRMCFTRHAEAHALKVGQIHAGIWLTQLAVQSEKQAGATAEWSVQALADRTVPVPNGLPGETFLALSSPGTAGASSSLIAFVGLGGNGTLGLYAWSDGKLNIVAAARSDSVGGVAFVDFPEPPSVHGSRVIFLAGLSDGTSGIYSYDLAQEQTESTRTYKTIITDNAVVDGVDVDYLGFARDAVHGDTTALYMVLMNQTWGVYTVQG